MNSLEEIKTKLQVLKVPETETDKVVMDVLDLIAVAALKSYVAELTDEQKDELKSVAELDIPRYLKNNNDRFPSMAPEKLELIYQETWDNYFKTLE